jgi:hypothetical protein
MFHIYQRLLIGASVLESDEREVEMLLGHKPLLSRGTFGEY